MKGDLKMKRVFICVLFIVLCASLFAREDGNESTNKTKLELTSNSRMLRIGQTAIVQLKITGQPVADIIYDLDTSLKPEPEFTCSFPVKASVKGEMYIGPYSLSFNGEELVSNSLLIKVFPEWDGEYGTFFRVDCNEINLGQSIELVMETWSKEKNNINIFANHMPESATVVSQGVNNQLTIINNEQNHYYKSSWLITPKSAGYFLITEDFFRDFPEGINPPEFIINVKETKNEGEI